MTTLSDAPTATLLLSPSGIEQYLSCPRQYYYSNLLGLTDPSTSLHAVYGQVVHRLMQVINTKNNYFSPQATGVAELCQLLDDTLGALLSVSLDNLPESPLVPSTTLKLLPPSLLERLLQLNLLQRQQLQKWVQLACQSLLQGPYFQLASEYNVLSTEQKLSWPTVYGVQGVTLAGRLDVLLEHKQSKSLLLIDFKTSRSRLNDPEVEKAQRYFAKSLQPTAETLERDDWLSQMELQLPLYALMLQQQYPQRPISMALQFLRPALYGPPHFLALNLAECQDSMPIWQRVVVEYVIEPLLQGFSTDETVARLAFDPNPSTIGCGYCAYATICEQVSAQETSELDVFEEAWG